MSKGGSNNNTSQKLGLLALVAIVISSMIGSGVDGLPQNMAATSEIGPVIIAWLICGFGMYFIARIFMVLSDIRPDLQSGIYMYAREGFGAFVAFIVAWGYWLMTIFSNVAFAIMVMDTLNYFLPGDFKGGNNIPSIIGASILIWGFNYLVLSGTKLAGAINIIGTFAKLIPLSIFVFILVYFLNYEELTNNFWGNSATIPADNLGPIPAQILAPLDIALWCFIGVEGAVALSGRARNKKDVGKATLIGFIVSLIICIFISVLPFGVLPQKALSTIPTPSTAGILKTVVGDWGEWLINIGVLVSVLTSWLAWTMICAEIPMAAAQNGTFPKVFSVKNKNGAASTSLWVSSLFMQLVVFVVYFSNNAWLTMLAISALMVLPAYLTSSAYLLQLCLSNNFAKYANKGKTSALISGLIGLTFCLFMFYACEIKYLSMVPILLTLGIPLFIWSRYQEGQELFSPIERILFIFIIVLDILTVFLYLNDYIKF